MGVWDETSFGNDTAAQWAGEDSMNEDALAWSADRSEELGDRVSRDFAVVALRRVLTPAFELPLPMEQSKHHGEWLLGLADLMTRLNAFGD